MNAERVCVPDVRRARQQSHRFQSTHEPVNRQSVFISCATRDETCSEAYRDGHLIDSGLSMRLAE